MLNRPGTAFDPASAGGRTTATEYVLQPELPFPSKARARSEISRNQIVRPGAAKSSRSSSIPSPEHNRRCCAAPECNSPDRRGCIDPLRGDSCPFRRELRWQSGFDSAIGSWQLRRSDWFQRAGSAERLTSPTVLRHSPHRWNPLSNTLFRDAHNAPAWSQYPAVAIELLMKPYRRAHEPDNCPLK